MIFPHTWKEDHTEILKTSWEQGFPATTIVKRLAEIGYHVTRNAVIGKVHRMGLTRKPKIKKDVPAVRRPIRFKPKPVPVIYRRSLPSANPVEAEPKTPDPTKQILLIHTEEGHCRAIVGYKNGHASEAVCCGEITPWVVTDRGRKRSPWCAYHHNAYTSEKKKK